MAKQIKQIRYFGDNGDTRNFPSSVSKTKLTQVGYFETCGISKILQLSIHTLPGTRLVFNGDSDRPIYVGHSGVYQLDLTDTSAILWSVSFFEEDLDDIVASNAGLIIDILYEDDSTGENGEGCESNATTEMVITSTGGKASITVNTNIKNIHKNLWYGVSEAVSPYIMTDTAERAKKEEYLTALRTLQDIYDEHVAAITDEDGNITDPYLMIQYTQCYREKLIELTKKYEDVLTVNYIEPEIIVNVPEDQGGSGSSHGLVNSFAGNNPNVGVSQQALNLFADSVEDAFDAIDIDFGIERGTNALVINNNTAKPDFNNNND